MIRLTAADVRLGVRARDKTDAIRAAGALLVERGYIAPDYIASMLGREDQANTFLGRGLRLCLRQPALFLPQLRAIYRASALGPVRIMLPMVSSVEEVRAARRIAEGVRRELAVAPVEIGIMIEVPSAVLMAPELAREADFFSIGTNDLTQYILAMDRTHPTLAPHADGLHPAVLRAVDLAVRAAAAADRWVGVCGGIAGDPVGALILTGLGVDELSMSLPSVAAVKAACGAPRSGRRRPSRARPSRARPRTRSGRSRCRSLVGRWTRAARRTLSAAKGA